jgi:hypothetical protein
MPTLPSHSVPSRFPAVLYPFLSSACPSCWYSQRSARRSDVPPKESARRANTPRPRRKPAPTPRRPHRRPLISQCNPMRERNRSLSLAHAKNTPHVPTGATTDHRRNRLVGRSICLCGMPTALRGPGLGSGRASVVGDGGQLISFLSPPAQLDHASPAPVAQGASVRRWTIGRTGSALAEPCRSMPGLTGSSSCNPGGGSSLLDVCACGCGAGACGAFC